MATEVSLSRDIQQPVEQELLITLLPKEHKNILFRRLFSFTTIGFTELLSLGCSKIIVRPENLGEPMLETENNVIFPAVFHILPVTEGLRGDTPTKSLRNFVVV